MIDRGRWYRIGLSGVWCWLAATAALADAVRAPLPPVTVEVELNGQRFTLPKGFEIEVAAGPPLIERPIVADFDEQGRLYVAESSGTNDPVQKQLAERPHRILRLEDTDGDGRYDRRTVFADRMMFPEGLLWRGGSVYVAAPPSIWKLTDTDGDGVADQRQEWFQGKTLTGCANDLHGPYAGPDGWIYWCKGAFAEQTYERPGRKPLVTRAAHIFRCRADGTGIEPVMTGGMDNPVDVVFTPGGERIFTTTFFQYPGGGQRDGLIHAIYGGVYGKVHGVIDGHPRTSAEVMPVLTHLGPAAPCGLTRYESDQFGPGYRDNLFAALFNMQKVTRHVLQPTGATFTSHDTDFVVSASKDFHPTDVRDDADGSLLVIDTGGWYKLCCPTSQLWKPDVLGAIYRIRRTGANSPADPRGLRLEWSAVSVDALIERLDDPRPAVRERAIATLAGRGAAAVPVLAAAIRTETTPDARRNAVWAATRIDQPAARAAVRAALADADATVRQAALHSISVWRDAAAVPQLLEQLVSPAPHNRRAAAEALGRIGNPQAVPALLRAFAEPADRALDHALVFALIEIAAPEGTAAGLASGNPRQRRAALVALDQMDGSPLTAEQLRPALSSGKPALRETAWWIASRHPEWGAALSDILRPQLAAESLSPEQRTELEGQLARFAASAAIQQLLADRLGDPAAPRTERQSILRVMARSGLKAVPDAWVARLAALLGSDDAELVTQTVTTVRALPLRKETAAPLTAELLRIAADDTAAVDVRLDALAAISGGPAALSPALFTMVRTLLGPEEPVGRRATAVDVLARAKLSREQLLELTEVVPAVGPLELDRLLAAFEHSRDEAVGRALVAALGRSVALASLRAETLRPRLARFGKSVEADAAPLYARLEAQFGAQKARLEQAAQSLSAGDIRRGQAVFNSRKAACSSCHAIGYLGGTVGPDLTRIGRIRTGRDLLEAILFPSASFVRSYEPVTVVTVEGKVRNGLLRGDTPDEITLITGANQQVRLPRADIEELRPGTVSVMPAGLDQQLSPQELADLVAFLSACR